eukprot:TRINITY_DN1299_c0_g2_i3.p2 TRINITY_DN1299_c0_g2~~TRINITY_DN1299_c0_g2_i3.p2  ORF type:complete len:240 (-),score=18.39 TRINITY_DN1299_c0_g2_i3:1329-2048(-)
MSCQIPNKLNAVSNQGPSRKIRILCLHGLRTSGEILKQQLTLAQWPQKLGDYIYFDCITAPHPASGKIPGDVSFPPPYFEWFNSIEVADEMHYLGLEQSLNYLESYMDENGPYDGLLGFSQGAAMISLIAMLQQEGLRFDRYSTFQFCICIAGGIRPRDRIYKDMFIEDGVLKTPSIHIIGEKDQLRRFSTYLAELYSDRCVWYHHRGHVVPALSDQQIQDIKDFVVSNVKPQTTQCKL